jgi:hypothetical protein
MNIKPQFKDVPLRLFWFCVGIALLALGLVGKSPGGLRVSLWRRAAGIAGGFFFIYVSLMYYLPKYRKMREQLDEELEEAERESDEVERKVRSHDNSQT